MGDISDAEGSILMNELRRAEIFADAAGNAVEASASYTMRVCCSRPTARTARQLHRKTRTNGCKVVGLVLDRRLLRLRVVTDAAIALRDGDWGSRIWRLKRRNQRPEQDRPIEMMRCLDDGEVSRPGDCGRYLGDPDLDHHLGGA